MTLRSATGKWKKFQRLSSDFTEYLDIQENDVARISNLSLDKTCDILQKMTTSELASYHPQKNTPQISFLTVRLPSGHLDINPALLRQLKKNEIERLSVMEDYLLLEKACRSVFLARYFGENQAADCGICDHCLSENRKEKPGSFSYYKPLITRSLSEGKSMIQLESEFRAEERPAIRECVQFLLKEEILTAGEGNLLELSSRKKKGNYLF
jgi:ATP-dependent DNA helicase RecQ